MHPLAHNIPGIILFSLLWILSLGFFSWSLYQIYLFMKKSQPDDRLKNLPERINAFITFVLGQKRLLNEPFPGLLHVFIFWGFIVLNLGVLLDFGEGLIPWFAGVRQSNFYLYFSFLVDLFCLLVLLLEF